MTQVKMVAYNLELPPIVICDNDLE
jgi:hypothetical protein